MKPLSLCHYKDTTYVLFETVEKTHRVLFIAETNDGLHFNRNKRTVIRLGSILKPEKLEHLHNFILSCDQSGFYLSYIRNKISKKGVHKEVLISKSKDGVRFTETKSTKLSHPGIIIPDYAYQGNKTMFLANHFITTAFEKKTWQESGSIIIAPREGFFDKGHLRLISGNIRDSGILLVYESISRDKDRITIKLGAVLVSINNPNHVLWRSDIPLYEKTLDPTDHYRTLGATTVNDSMTLYFYSSKKGFIAIRVPCVIHVRSKERILHRSVLKRHEGNPIMKPIPENSWEKEAVFNPAVLHEDDTVHMWYRAMGNDGISRLGYATSTDGVNFNERLSCPVYEPTPCVHDGPKRYDPKIYPSGGSWGGCEDPRAVKIDNRIYITYVAFEGWHSIRMALTSISSSDLEHKNWKWRKPKLISKPGEMNKNWVLFPEKINGKYAVLHSISPEILIDYVDKMSDLGKNKQIESRPPKGGREENWDSRVRGAGPPPLKTRLGWLLLYHATDKYEPHKYKLGAMILDTNDPTKILYRSAQPILCPDMPYENDGKPGIVYASGAIIKDESLMVYYGGGDKVVCVASIPVETLLEKMVDHGDIKLHTMEAVLV